MASKIIFYDLDGTLVDSMPGIAMSLRYTLNEMKIAQPSDEEIRKAIGPGLHKALESILQTQDSDLIASAVRIYRAHYDSSGYKATELYAGIKELIAEMHSLKIPQIVVSMKSDTVVKPILSYLELLDIFTDALGSDPSGKTHTKAEMLSFLANKHSINLADSILVGDTLHDANAAKQLEVPFAGVTFGYGTKAEIESVQWGQIFNSVSDLKKGLLQFVRD